MRYAIYFTPPDGTPLAERAASWLGRDPFTGMTLPPRAVGQLDAAEVAYHTAAARRYGFHATVKAPFRLAPGETEWTLRAAFESFCAMAAPVTVPRIELGRIDRFFALVPAEASAALDALASDVVIAFDRFRAPLTDAEIERRNPESLRPLELKYLHLWGYPHVFDAFRFHMTLTGRVGDVDRDRVAAAIATHFSDHVGQPLEIGSLSLFAEADDAAPFVVQMTCPLGTRNVERKSA